MKCKKCGSEDFEIKIVDIINEKDHHSAIDLVLVIAWLVAIFSGIYIASILFGSDTSSGKLLEAIAGTLTDAVEVVLLWKVFSGSVLTIIVCKLYNKLLPYKVIPVKKAVCKSCGNEQDDTE